MAPKFLCCLPLRLGVVVISFIQFLLAGASAAFAWWARWYADRHDLSELTKGANIALIVYASIYTAAAVLSFVGFLGALFKKLGAIRTYLFALVLALLAQIATAIYVLITYYRGRNISGPECVWKDSRFENGSIDLCAEWRKAPQWAVIIAVIIPILVELYACYVVGAYSSRLKNQRDSQYLASTNAVFNGTPSYIPVARAEEAHPLTEPAVHYPYSDQTHSFGDKTYNQNATHNA